MFRIAKEVVIHAAHRLPSMPEGHPCRNLHGHTYKVIVTLGSQTLDKGGLVVEFSQLTAIIKQYDHQFLGGGKLTIDGHLVENMLGDAPATAEVFAATIAGQINGGLLAAINEGTTAKERVELLEVQLWETPTACVVWTP